jgi:GH25 family lysozyme M1 (1,4-beta-N-acetylmuramidase)
MSYSPTSARRIERRAWPILTAAAVLATTAINVDARPLGIDVSSYQGTPNWSSIKSCGWTFAWAKATEGATINDGDYRYNINNGKAAGVYMGAYHFAHPNLNSPGTEAGHFWSIISGDVSKDGKSMMPTLDFEVFSGVTGASSYTAWANSFNTTIKNNAAAKGVTIDPVLYTSSCSACNFGSSVDQWLPWIADYNGQSSQSGTPWSTCGSCDLWSDWTAWQYSSSGSVCGVGGGCDVDVFNGTSANLVNTLVIDGGGTSTYAPGPEAVSWGSGRIDVVARGGGDAIYHKYFISGTGWLPTDHFEDIGGIANNGPGISSWGPNRLDVFCPDTSDSLRHKYFNGTDWLPSPHWEDIGGT